MLRKAKKQEDPADQLIAELRKDGKDAIADVVQWIKSLGDVSASDLPPLAKFADWCATQQVNRDVAMTKGPELATWCGVSPQTIGRWVRDGMPRAKGSYHLPSVLGWFAEHYGQLRALRRRFDRLKDTADQHKTVKLETAEVDLATKKGELVKWDQVETRWTQQCHRVRSELQRLPESLAGKLVGLNRAEVVSALEAEFKRLCNLFAKG